MVRFYTLTATVLSDGSIDIHAVMIQDKVRTATYASYILTHPEVFRDAIVLDVGCGTGILSLFAARAGAKRVFAVDASDIAEKAEKIVKENGFENVITFVRSSLSKPSVYLLTLLRLELFAARLKISHYRMVSLKWTSLSQSGWVTLFYTSLC